MFCLCLETLTWERRSHPQGVYGHVKAILQTLTSPPAPLLVFQLPVRLRFFFDRFNRQHTLLLCQKGGFCSLWRLMSDIQRAYSACYSIYFTYITSAQTNSSLSPFTAVFPQQLTCKPHLVSPTTPGTGLFGSSEHELPLRNPSHRGCRRL